MSETSEQDQEPDSDPPGIGGDNGRQGGKKGQKHPPQILIDMRAVWRGTVETDKGASQERLRKWLEENQSKFIDRMLAIEREYERGRSATERGVAGGAVDEKLRVEEIRGMLKGVLARTKGEVVDPPVVLPPPKQEPKKKKGKK